MADIQLLIKPNSRDSSAANMLLTKESIECELVKIEPNFYQVCFVLKSIERHFVEIYYDKEFVNMERPIKLDTFDVKRIKANISSTITFGEINTFTGIYRLY